MSDIKFNCPHCQQKLSIPETALGRTIPCPICQGHIGLPAKRAPKTSQPETARVAEVPNPGVTSRPPQPPVPPPPHPVSPANPPPLSDIEFPCPICSAKLVVTGRAAGRPILCKCCGSRIVVPVATPATPSGAALPPTPTEPPSKETVEGLIEKLRAGEDQAGMALIRMGEAMIPIMIEGFKEYRLEDPDTNSGAAHIVKILAKCGGVCVPPLIAKLGKSRHAYYALARIGTSDAVDALVRELTSVNWRRVAVACKALGQIENRNVLKVLDKIADVRKSTRVGEVFSAAGETLDAIRARFPDAQVPETALPKAQPLKATIAIKNVY